MQNKIQIKRKEVNIILKDTATFLYLDTKTREIDKKDGVNIKACITKLDSVNPERLIEQDFHGIATRMDNSLNQAIQVVFRGGQTALNIPKNLKHNQALGQNFEQKYNVIEWSGDFYRIISNEMHYKGSFNMVFGVLLVDSVVIINNMLTHDSSEQAGNNINIISGNNSGNGIGNNTSLHRDTSYLQDNNLFRNNNNSNNNDEL